jgi:BirA family biotin operon repressor/biotin-[acetyl-CoA-carboxylase] ligase
MDNLRFPKKYPKLTHLAFNSLCHAKLNAQGFNPEIFEIRSLEICKSTNDEVAKHLKSYLYSIVLSMTQEAGRGRKGNIWESELGGMWLSIGVNNKSKIVELSSLVIEAVKEVLDFCHISDVKSPNDLLINGKKVCGVLVETKSTGDEFEQVIIGIGVNVFNDISDDLIDNATRLKDHCDPPSIPELASDITLSVLNKLPFLFKNAVYQ